ncbi:MAG: SGNH/GDSL hydrolase family protein [Pyrinomonadaceae bacterium]
MKTFTFIFIALAALSITGQTEDDCAAAKKNLTEAYTKLNDWAQLGRYADANAKVSPPQKGELRVVFIGDSITDIWDENGFGGFFPEKPFINRGIGGQTTPQMLVRFRPDVIDLKPKVVVILAGTNDISGNTGPMTLEQTGANISSMAQLATANGIKVVLSAVLPVSDTVKKQNGEFYIQTKSRPPAKIMAMNNWLKKYAAQNKYTYLDYYSATVKANGFIKDGITFDGLHPNKEGYAIMNPLVEDAIKRALNSKK